MAWPNAASAINGSRPRVPPSFYGGACVTVVGRDAPLLEVGVTFPYEDVELTDDELPDSRTVGLYAFARDLPPGATLPNWVQSGDVQRAVETGLIDAPPQPEALLPTSSWADVAWGVVDERLPIACESAGPWPWNTQAVPPGAYVLWGYTFEPPLNLWTPRPGVVRVVDAAGSGPPAVALSDLDGRREFGVEQGLEVMGCLSADPGTQVVLSWARAADPQTWTVFDVLEPGGDTFTSWLAPPNDALYDALYVRAEARDPAGRSFIHHARGALVVLAECVDEPLTRPDVADGCGLADASNEVTPLEPAPCVPVGAEADTDDIEGASDRGSPGCSTAGGHGGWLGALLGCLIALRRPSRLARLRL